jgi:2-polyprenyl-6-methoxyphenol hydroxylase-like FAD-dependent oxidoreductase
MTSDYDVIVVGARCAGSPTAMLLARLGHRVLLVDRTHFPSDTVSTHHLHQTATAALSRWGLLDRVAASGAPATREIGFDFEGIRFVGTPPAPTEGITEAYSVRRRVLDTILVEAAVLAGAELRDRFTVKDLEFEEGRVAGIRGRGRGGRHVVDRARVVVGADGLRSTVARLVEAEVYDQIEPLTHTYYTYWSGVPIERLEFYGRAGWAWPSIQPTTA